jgi:trypsin
MNSNINHLVSTISLVIVSFSLVSGGSIRGSQSSLFGNSGFQNEVSPAETRIIGGQETSKMRFPYAVSIQDNIGHFCGGSLIAPDMILTAAHCQGGSYNVVIGRHDLGSNDGESIPMKMETPHPKYDDKTTDNDWMLVLLDRPTAVNVPFVKLNTDTNVPSVGEDVTVMGWGDMTSDDLTQELADVLMSVDINVISNQDCDDSSGTINGWTDSYNGQITDNMLCAADKGQDSCQGDSGGPLVIQGRNGDGSDDVQIGVVSWGIGCASSDFPGVYSRVSQAYEWIVSEVCKQSSVPPAELCGDSPGSAFTDEDAFDNGNNGQDNEENDDYAPHSSSSGNDDFADDLSYDDNVAEENNVDDATEYEGDYSYGETGDAGDDNYDDDYSYDDIHSTENAGGNDDYSYDDNNLGGNDENDGSDDNNFDNSGVSSNGNWATIIEDDFKSDFGFFNSGGSDAKWVRDKKDRSGVLIMQDGNGDSSSVYSNVITETSYSVFRVVFSVFLVGMEDDDRFCFDISADGGSDWIEKKCWSTNELSSKAWHDDVIAEFEAENASELTVRFRCQGNHNQDDVFIDKIAIQGLQ